MLAISMTPYKQTFWNSQKFLFFLLIPLCAIGASGLSIVASKFKISPKMLLTIIIVLSIPSLAAYQISVDKSSREFSRNFMNPEDYNALLWLNDQPYGRVMSSGFTGYFIPYYSHKTAISFCDAILPCSENEDYKRFYRTSEQEERNNIINRNKISYVFYGNNEVLLNPVFDDSGLEKIYMKDGVAIYRVKSTE